MSKNKVSITVGPSFLSILTILFICLKLLGKINWSWWLVTLPTWGPIALLLTFLLVLFLIALAD